MSELIEVDPATGEEDLVATGTEEELITLAAEWIAEKISEGMEPAGYRVQPAA